MHLVRRGELVQDVVDVIMSNIRVPEERLGDMRAQLGALSIGEQRLTALLDKYGERTVSAVIAEMRARSETLMRAHIEAIPDGCYSFSAFVDSDGITDDILEVALDVRVQRAPTSVSTTPAAARPAAARSTRCGRPRWARRCAG